MEAFNRWWRGRRRTASRMEEGEERGRERYVGK